MSLYNLLHGVNPISPILLAVLKIDQSMKDAPKYPKNEQGEDWYPYDDGLIPAGEKYIKECIEKKYWQSGRFRDIYLNKNGTKIILYTRNGGGNRESYFYIFDILKKHPNYLKDYDDDFDCTYAYIEFSVPKKAKELCKELSTGKNPETIQEKFTKEK